MDFIRINLYNFSQMIKRKNGKWLVNSKELKNCYTYEIEYFQNFLKFMRLANEQQETENVRTKISHKTNYKFNYKQIF